ncbi:hypothetical protein C8035_v010251 [Colletotrichum spinosum]|uniref:Uncharacterized protein n=1 Tax=Colletotrichum spinosum TaxID=1347390 RepID=A0A4R8QHB2_9PEZI|nr:hypothetical protein C8035_v010251 [Colletotrichum spinosum]
MLATESPFDDPVEGQLVETRGQVHQQYQGKERADAYFPRSASKFKVPGSIRRTGFSFVARRVSPDWLAPVSDTDD